MDSVNLAWAGTTPLHGLGESIPVYRVLGSLNVYKFGLRVDKTQNLAPKQMD
jgi:hypothetical protein